MVHPTPNIEVIFVEINLRKRKWLLICSYNPEKKMIQTYLNCLGDKLNELSLKCEHIILMGDLNSEMCEEAMNTFCNTYNLKCLVKEPTCFKSIEKPSCIDLILTNKALCFQHTSVIETGLSDFHMLTVTVFKYSFHKKEPKLFSYRKYKYFNNDNFRNDLLQEIHQVGLSNIGCEQFESLFICNLNKHAPLKRRYVRANNSPFMNKELYKAIMVRSRLRNKPLKLKTIESREAYKRQRNYCVSLIRKTIESREAYKRQRNYCVSLIRKTKKSCYENLSPNLITDNRKFWKQVKPFFSDKTPINNNIILLEDDEIGTNPSACAEILNNFFVNSIKNLDIDRGLHTVNITVITDDPVENAIEKFKRHPRITRINEEEFTQDKFSFQDVTKSGISLVIKNIDSSKSYQKENIPPKLLK